MHIKNTFKALFTQNSTFSDKKDKDTGINSSGYRYFRTANALANQGYS